VTNQLTARVTCIEEACLAAMGFIEVAGDGALEKDLDKWEEDGCMEELNRSNVQSLLMICSSRRTIRDPGKCIFIQHPG
jgi:hypothetical protein